MVLAAITAEQIGHWQQNGASATAVATASAAAIGDAVASAAAPPGAAAVVRYRVADRS